jgi:hypothetical protein
MRGFYPGEGQALRSIDREPVPGNIYSDKEERNGLRKRGYHVKFTVKVMNPSVTLDEVVAFMDSYDKQNLYDLDDNSCGHFVLAVARFVGVPVPPAFGTLTIRKDGKSKTVVAPCAMGEDFMLIGGSRR